MRSNLDAQAFASAMLNMMQQFENGNQKPTPPPGFPPSPAPPFDHNPFSCNMAKFKLRSKVSEISPQKSSDSVIDFGATNHFFHRRTTFMSYKKMEESRSWKHPQCHKLSELGPSSCSYQAVSSSKHIMLQSSPRKSVPSHGYSVCLSYCSRNPYDRIRHASSFVRVNSQYLNNPMVPSQGWSLPNLNSRSFGKTDTNT